MKLLCKQLGGSHSYGLSTLNSDVDFRGVFINTDKSSLIGLGRHDFQKGQANSDEFYTELRNAFRLLRSGNTQMIELLYADEWIEISPEWEFIRSFRHQLVDSDQLFKCLRGYMQGELKLANGERTGKLGSQRKAAIDKYGFSPKNFVQLLRLAWCGVTYFTDGFFPVNVGAHAPVFQEKLLNIKTHPEQYTKEALNHHVKEWEDLLVKSYESRHVKTTFNQELADDLCLRIYRPLITSLTIN